MVSTLGSALLNTGFCLCSYKRTYVLQARAPESQPRSSVCVTLFHLKQVTNLKVSNIKRRLAYFQSFIERCLPHRRSIFKRFMFERWRLAGFSFNMISPRLSSVNCLQWRIQGRGQGASLPLFFHQTETRRAEIFFFDRSPPPPLISGSGWPGPPYLKVWIRHWFVPLEHSLSSLGLGLTV